jgi:hypothetical protein
MARPALIFPTEHEGALLDAWIADAGLESVLPVVTTGFVAAHGARPGWLVEERLEPSAALRDRIRHALQARELRVAGVLSVDDEDAFRFGRWLAGELGVGCQGVATAERSWNKLLQKRAFVRTGVPTPAFQAWEVARGPGAVTIAPPCVIKAPTFNGSECVLPCETAAELEDHAAVLSRGLDRYATDSRAAPRCIESEPNPWGDPARPFDPTRIWLVESVVRGTEYSADFLVRDGELLLLRAGRKYHADDFGYFRGFRMFSRETLGSELDEEELLDLGRKLATALDLGGPASVFMTDFVRTPAGFQVLEASARPGMSVFVHLMWALGRNTSFGEWTRAWLDPAYRPRYVGVDGLAVFLRSSGAGVFEGIRETPSAALAKRCLETRAYARPGDRLSVSPVDRWDRVVGHALFSLERRDDPEALLEEAERSFRAMVGAP